MNKIQATGSTHINRSSEEVFEFLCDPDVDPAELTPMEDRITDWQAMRGVGSSCRTTIEFVARELECTTTCIEFDPPHRLTTQIDGDLAGTQRWQLTPQEDGTQLQLTFEMVEPQWLPAYLREETTAARWAQMLVDQTLTNVKSALESLTSLGAADTS